MRTEPSAPPQRHDWSAKRQPQDAYRGSVLQRLRLGTVAGGPNRLPLRAEALELAERRGERTFAAVHALAAHRGLGGVAAGGRSTGHNRECAVPRRALPDDGRRRVPRSHVGLPLPERAMTRYIGSPTRSTDTPSVPRWSHSVVESDGMPQAASRSA